MSQTETLTPWFLDFPVGTRVETIAPIDVYPTIYLPAGKRGFVAEVNKNGLMVTLTTERKMLDRIEARDLLRRINPDRRDYHALNSSAVEALLVEADRRKYRQPKNANGSRARYFHAYLERRANNKA